MGLVLVSSLGCASLGLAPPPPPALAVLVVVDQLRPDRLSPAQSGGLGRLQREGRVFDSARLSYAFTETCPGHATATSGRLPSRTGIPSNRFVVEGELQPTYCVLDETPLGRIVTSSTSGVEQPDAAPTAGRSPALLRSDGLGDWLKASFPTARVHSVSAKDRAAILLGGRGADGAWWLDREGDGGMVTSRFYRESLPEWVAGWDRDRMLSDLPPEWTHPAHDPTGRIRGDDYAAEDPRFSRTSPHPLNESGQPKESLRRLLASPLLDRLVLEFSLELVEREGLGLREDGGTDLLAIGLSGTDFIGHLYGPFSQESRAALAALDDDLGVFLAALESRIGAGRVVVVLTSDHGVLPLPEWVQEVDLPENECPAEGGRIPERSLLDGVRSAVDEAMGDEGIERGPWLVAHGLHLHANRDRLAATGGADESRFEAIDTAIREALVNEGAIERVWSRGEIESRGEISNEDDRARRLLRASLVRGRAPDWVLHPRRGCLVSDRAHGTSHGSLHDYDRRIPLVFWGPEIEPGVESRGARLVDLAPTLARELGVEIPPDLNGRPLPLPSRRDD